MRYLSIALLSLIVLTGACRNKDLIRPGDPLNVAYDKSLALYEAGKYDDAAYGFDLVTRMGRGQTSRKMRSFTLLKVITMIISTYYSLRISAIYQLLSA